MSIESDQKLSKTETDVEKVENMESFRRKRAKEFNLSETATWDEIIEAGEAAYRKQLTTKLGLPEDASPELINGAQAEAYRKRMILELDLPEDTPLNVVAVMDMESLMESLRESDDVVYNYLRRN